MKNIWVPNVSLGDIVIGRNISVYEKSVGAVVNPEISSDITGWVNYDIPGTETDISVENGMVVAVSSYESCVYNNIEMIGLSREELESLLGCQPDEEGDPVLFDNGDISTPLEFFKLGAEVWLEDGKVTLVSISDSRE
jgi:hypothetical protein